VRLGRTVLIAESELQHVPHYAQRIYVMERGEVVFGGSLDAARRDPAVQRIIGTTV
jgi:branched-chain amino acid transport system ATP-binding protein